MNCVAPNLYLATKTWGYITTHTPSLSPDEVGSILFLRNCRRHGRPPHRHNPLRPSLPRRVCPLHHLRLSREQQGVLPPHRLREVPKPLVERAKHGGATRSAGRAAGRRGFSGRGSCVVGLLRRRTSRRLYPGQAREVFGGRRERRALPILRGDTGTAGEFVLPCWRRSFHTS